MRNTKLIEKEIRLDHLSEFLEKAESSRTYLQDRISVLEEELGMIPEDEREYDYRSSELLELPVKIRAIEELITQLEKLL